MQNMCKLVCIQQNAYTASHTKCITLKEACKSCEIYIMRYIMSYANNKHCSVDARHG